VPLMRITPEDQATAGLLLEASWGATGLAAMSWPWRVLAMARQQMS
jgi:hypothetical protein